MAVALLTPSRLRRAAWGVALAGALCGVVAAQPAPGPAPPAPPAPAAAVPPPIQIAPALEEAPPINVPPPEPISVPPVDDADVEPAVAPKEQVAEKPAPEPIRRARYDVAILQAIDKVTAETLRFEAAVGRPVRWKGLIFTVRACERSAPDEPIQDSIAYVAIDSQPRPQPGKLALPPRQAFKGWMFASSPGLHPMEHPTYDAWVIACRAAAPPAVAQR